MPGRRLEAPRHGDRAEYLALYLLSRIAQVIPVPRQEDFGIDAVGSVLVAKDGLVHQRERFEIQIKKASKDRRIVYGGRRNGRWMHHEVTWLLEGSPLPVFFGYVDLGSQTLDIYSSAGIWRMRAGYGSALPTEVRLHPDESVLHEWLLGEHDDATAPGDGTIRGVPLGGPIARISTDLLGCDDACEQVAECLRRWCRIDDWNRLMARTGIPVFIACYSWKRNEPLRVEDVEFSACTGSDAAARIDRVKGMMAAMNMGLRLNAGLLDHEHEADKALADLDAATESGTLDALMRSVVLGGDASSENGASHRTP